MIDIKLNPDKKLVQEIKENIKLNNGYCPCKIIKSLDNICPCIDLRVNKNCNCGLYIIEENK